MALPRKTTSHSFALWLGHRFLLIVLSGIGLAGASKDDTNLPFKFAYIIYFKVEAFIASFVSVISSTFYIATFSLSYWFIFTTDGFLGLWKCRQFFCDFVWTFWGHHLFEWLRKNFSIVALPDNTCCRDGRVVYDALHKATCDTYLGSRIERCAHWGCRGPFFWQKIASWPDMPFLCCIDERGCVVLDFKILAKYIDFSPNIFPTGSSFFWRSTSLPVHCICGVTLVTWKKHFLRPSDEDSWR